MKLHEKCLAALLSLIALVLVASACSGGSEAVATPTVEPVETPGAEPEPTPTATPEQPTPDPAELVTDQQRIDAAVAQFEVDVAAGEIPSVFAYDLLDTTVKESGSVTLTICAWTGESVFDQVRDSIYRTTVAADATVTASHTSTPVAAGECANTQLIESALDHINAYGGLVTEASASPALYESDPRRVLLSDEFDASTAELYAGFAEDGIYFENTRPPGDIAETAVADLLWRRFRSNGLAVIEVAICRDMVPGRGMYRDGVLVDDERSDDSPGLHSMESIQLISASETADGWLVAGHKSIIWSDCFFAGEWLEGANIFQPRDTLFEELPQ